MTVLESLKGWTVAANFLLAAHRYHGRVKAVQAAWRATMQQTAQRRAEASAKWLRLERNVVAAEIGAEERAARLHPQRKRRPEAKVALTTAERIEMRLVEPAVRDQLVAAALAAKRRSLRTRMQQYMANVRSWKRALADWKESRHAHRVIRGSASVNMPMPPVPPKVSLDETEIATLVARARGARARGSTSPRVVAVAPSPSAVASSPTGPGRRAPSGSPSARRVPSGSASPTVPRRRLTRARTVTDVFWESERRTEELLKEAGSPVSPNDCPPPEGDIRLRPLLA